MKITENVHLIRKEFYVTPEVKRYINIYLITGESCYLIDSGVSGSEKIIDEYLHSIGRNMSDIKGIFLTHAHPDHIGGAAEIKRITDCKVYAPMVEIDWIEDIDIQYRERPIPNFYTLLSESVKVDVPLQDGDSITLEEGIEISAFCKADLPHAFRRTTALVKDIDVQDVREKNVNEKKLNEIYDEVKVTKSAVGR